MEIELDFNKNAIWNLGQGTNQFLSLENFYKMKEMENAYTYLSAKYQIRNVVFVDWKARFDLVLSSESIIGFFKAVSSRLSYRDWRVRKDSSVLALLHPEKLFCYVIIITRQRLDVKYIKIALSCMRPCSRHYLSSSATSTPLFWKFRTSDFAIKIFHRIILHNGKSNEILHNYIFNRLVGQRMLLPFF